MPERARCGQGRSAIVAGRRGRRWGDIQTVRGWLTALDRHAGRPRVASYTDASTSSRHVGCRRAVRGIARPQRRRLRVVTERRQLDPISWRPAQQSAQSRSSRHRRHRPRAKPRGCPSASTTRIRDLSACSTVATAARAPSARRGCLGNTVRDRDRSPHDSWQS